MKSKHYKMKKQTQSIIKPIKVVSFVYEKDDGDVAWRTVSMIQNNRYWLAGFDTDMQYKRFNKRNIIGNKLITENVKPATIVLNKLGNSRSVISYIKA
jgi:hypothetical protein